MAVYPPQIAALVDDARFCRDVPFADAEGSEVLIECGCVVRAKLKIEGDDPTITSLGFLTNGCGFMVAAAEEFCRILEGKRLTELHGLDMLNASASRVDREACAEVAANAVRSALADLRSRRLKSEFTGEKPLVCTCFGISEETVERFIAEKHPTSTAEVAVSIRAGRGCGSCEMIIQEMIDAAGHGFTP